MKSSFIIPLKVQARPGSELSKAISRFIEERGKARQSLQKEFDKKNRKANQKN